MKTVMVLCALCLGSLWAGEPQFGSIDYTKPREYLGWPESLGDRGAIRKQASQLKADSDRETIRNVLNWMKRNLKHDSRLPGFFKTAPKVEAWRRGQERRGQPEASSVIFGAGVISCSKPNS
jgi:hypothetical protein